MAKILKQRQVDFTPALYEYYNDRCKVEVIYAKDDEGNKFPSILRIFQVQRDPWQMKHFNPFMGSNTKDFNPILDWDDATKINNL